MKQAPVQVLDEGGLGYLDRGPLLTVNTAMGMVTSEGTILHLQ